jgi:hypothetical protein
MTMFTLSGAATPSFDALRLLRMNCRGGVEGLKLICFQKTPLPIS